MKTAISQTKELSIGKVTIQYGYLIDANSQRIDVSYCAILASNTLANITPINFHIYKAQGVWQVGELNKEKFIANSDFVEDEIYNAIISQDPFFSAQDKLRTWQTFDLDNCKGKFRYSDSLKGYEVLFKQKIGFLDISDNELEEEGIIITQVAGDWITSRVISDNGREIIRTLVTNKIKDHILDKVKQTAST